ncbi:MAG: hypothetical protein K0S76_1867 [Herbinix sp.]|nr:hypothetical protein [Herbinix sp.]
MEKVTTAERLNQLMESQNLRQIDILNKAQPFCQLHGVKLSKSDLSQYVSGLVVPGQDKLAVLGEALNVNEAWLMGYDVPMDTRVNYNSVQQKVDYMMEESMNYHFRSSENRLLIAFRKLNELGKDEAVNRVTELTYIPKYVDNTTTPKKKKYTPTEEDLHSLVARNGKKMTREEAIEFISAMYSDDDEDE